jgi:hypothetical protein
MIRQRLQPTLALLDQGVTIYRRNLGPLLLLSAAWFVPVAILVGLAVTWSSWLSDDQQLLLLAGGALLALPLMVYLLVVLSRAASEAIEGQPIQVRHALSIRPLRIVGVSFFLIIYGIIMQMIAGIVGMICLCPAYVGGFSIFGLMSAASGSGSAPGMAAAIVGAIVLLGSQLASGLVGGAAYSSMVYGLQPWVSGQLSFGAAIERSLELTFYRFVPNALVWSLSALVLVTVGTCVSIVVGLLVPLPAIWLLGDGSKAAQAIAVAAWLSGLMLIAPLLPIWMNLLYRRNMRAREGIELQQRVQRWLEDAGAPAPSGAVQEGAEAT